MVTHRFSSGYLNFRQQIKSLNCTHRKECDEITKKLENWRCLGCRNQEQNVENNVDPVVKQIGFINTSFPEKRGTPRQPGICSNSVAKLVLNSDIFTNPNHALEGLSDFSHMWILFHFHKNDSTHTKAKVSPPRLNGIRTGVFATRSPHRPSLIGLSLVKIVKIEDNAIYFNGVDMVDKSPVFDIKPYIPQYDNPALININGPTQVHVLNSNSDASTSGAVTPDIEAVPPPSPRVMDGEENNERDAALGAPSLESSDFGSVLGEIENYYTR